MMGRADYYAGLPRKRMGSGCLLWDEGKRILLVKPTYKPGWEIPGGVVEADESPRAACERELVEELGLRRRVGRLLVFEYNEGVGEKTESLMFIFA
ncbi:MAG TPA: NUDIX hydrolase, partial [Anaerolineae bacterium]|nr:NUDIX hydrolase [Anaerolineae bacterium]